MHIQITGARQLKNMTLGDVREAAIWFLNKLIPKRTQKDIFISIKFIDFPPKSWSGCAHYCTIEDNGRPNDYIVWIKPNLSKRMLLKTMAHELVHVKQWWRRERKDFDFAVVKFKKKKYNEEKIKYANLPWEKEAFAREERLYREYMEYLKS